MSKKYRSWEDRRQIIKAIIADGNPKPITDFALSESEEIFFRARANKAIDKLAQHTSSFKAYYALPTEKPFGYVLGVALLIASGALISGMYVWITAADISKVYPIFAACATIMVAAVGWALAGWISHRNTTRQNTNTMLFTRFAQAPFGDALHIFHSGFGYEPAKLVTWEKMTELRSSEREEDRKLAASVSYILNYYELLCSGVLRGDLDLSIVRDNVRGLIIYYHDKCAPHVRHLNQANPRTYENLVKVRTHYREP